jgi:predicted GNAT family acetyltransferase
MKINQYSTANEFLLKCEVILLENETQNNLILGLADSLAKRKRQGNGELFFSIEDGGEIIAAALRTDVEKPISVSEVSNQAIDTFINYLLEKNIDLGGVVGEIKTSTYFAKEYTQTFKKPLKLFMHQGVYQLDELKVPPLMGNLLRVATEDDLSLVESFVHDFIKSCFPNDIKALDNVKTMSKRHIDHQALFLLEGSDGQLVSMACNNRETRNSGCISLVFTPDNQRGKGYGSLITALSSQRVLANGKKFCNLFTDLSNPTSNHIYQQIGYNKIGESKHFSFL